LMVECGMTPMQSIVATTSAAATLMKLDGEIGTVAPGKLADLILVNGDPLANIRLLQDHANISLVMQGGKIVKDQVGERSGARAKNGAKATTI
ncbi:MAG TPA: amidohydrolase family protein, partial [Ktedonobacterales bacterium]|nr:amidohydrolase family protein [Ktedonobacterales bacterium]